MAKNLISVDELSKEFPGKIICRQESFGIFEGEKIGLIGVNGCGKTTLLKMLCGLEPIDAGKITFRKNLSLRYLPQIPEINPEMNVYEHIYFSNIPEFVLIRKYYNSLRKLEHNPNTENQKMHEELVQEMDAKKAWEVELRAKSYLTKLGFTDLTKKVRLLSGGQKRRVDLARVLMDQPDILILDEPTNHLDIDTIEWFQNYLTEYKGTLVFVTHDRYFLDAVSNRILEMNNGKINFYAGNYSFYISKKELEITDQQRKETRRLAQLQKELKWLHRGARARTSKPKNHLDRVKELLDKSYLTNDNELDISFQSKRLGKSILDIKAISKSYDENKLIENFSYNFQKMDRIGIIGANGCGKTTLLRMLTGEEEIDSGKIKVGMNTHFSYFKQNVDEFGKDQTVLDYIRENADNIRTADGTLHSASEMLNRFLFDGKMQQNRIRSLSGGEKKRLYLLKSLMFGSNFIILDEPTNDLDIKTLEILEDYLDAFKGCVLLVSHDRYFLDRVVDYLFIFEGEKIIKFPGNYSDYLLVKRYQEEVAREKPNTTKNRSKEAPKGLSYNEKRELQELEMNIVKLEKRQQEIEQLLEEKAAVLGQEDFRRISKELEDLNLKYAQYSERWFALEEKNFE
ncbi:MAG: ABC-F family ATP-binding cassette domain-containing protein [Candidatus Cloacimonadales bacterium]|nr:ABC-F family ATP-binding cassette domain-containing protein [Candidatus Cloacimonadales bacterium]